MKAEYKRDMYKSYMIFEENKQLEESYELKMVSCNSILGLLKLEVKILDGDRKYYYDITSLKALSQVFQKAKINKEQMVIIMNGILDAMEHVREFLLKEDNLILDPEFIHLNLSEQEIRLVYLPGYDRSASEQFENLLEFLMDRTDYGQEEAVKLSYALYKINRSKNYSIQEFKDVISGGVIPFEGERLHIQKNNELEDNMIMERNITRNVTNNTKEREIENNNIGAFAWDSAFSRWIPWICCIFVVGSAFAIVWFSAKMGFFLNKISGQIEITKVVLFLIILGIAIAFLLGIIFGMGKQKVLTIKPEQIKRIGNVEKGEYTYSQEEKTTILTKEMLNNHNNTLEFYLSSLNKEIYQDIELTEFPFFIGKLKTNVDYVIRNQAVSRFHAKIEEEEGSFSIVDLNSTNGTFVNGERLLLNEKKKLCIGDEVMFADVAYNFIKL